MWLVRLLFGVGVWVQVCSRESVVIVDCLFVCMLSL